MRIGLDTLAGGGDASDFDDDIFGVFDTDYRPARGRNDRSGPDRGWWGTPRNDLAYRAHAEPTAAPDRAAGMAAGVRNSPAWFC